MPLYLQCDHPDIRLIFSLNNIVMPSCRLSRYVASVNQTLFSHLYFTNVTKGER